MLQNGAAVPRRSGAPALAQRTAACASGGLLTNLLHRFEVWTVLEAHAVSCAALSPRRDLATARSVLAQLNQRVIAAADPAPWHRLELELHQAIAQQSGNAVVATMAWRAHAEWQAIWLAGTGRRHHDLATLWRLQSQHRHILSCIEAGQPDDAIAHTHAHHRQLRRQLLRALPG